MAVQAAETAVCLAAAGTLSHQYRELANRFKTAAARVVADGVFDTGKHDPHGGELVDHLRQTFAVKLPAVSKDTRYHLAEAV